MSDLDASHQSKLDQLLAITATHEGDSRTRRSMEEVLRSSGWDVERAVNTLYASSSTATFANEDSAAADSVNAPLLSHSSSSPSRSPSSRHRTSPRLRAAGSTSRSQKSSSSQPPLVARVGLGTVYAIFWPIRFVLRVLIGIWYLIARTLLPNSVLRLLPRSVLPSSSTPSRYPEDYSLELTKSLPVSLAEMTSLQPEDLPQWFNTNGQGYKGFLRHIKDENKIGLVVLGCGEHEDDEEFKRNVLANPDLLHCLKENDIVIWGADIREREGYQVSQTLQITTFPAFTFFSVLPLGMSLTSPNIPSTSASINNARLTILASVAGPPSTITSSPAIVQLITNSLIPRVRPFLARRRRERLLREEERRLRSEQDRALRESERRDAEKLRQRQAEEELKRVQAEEEQRKLKVEEEKKRRQVRLRRQRAAWRHTIALDPEPSDADVKAGKAVRINVRLPNAPRIGGQRNVRVFPVGSDPKQVYLWVEHLLAEPGATEELSDYSDPYTSPDDQDKLQLFTAYPRKAVPVTSGEDGWRIIVDNGASLVAEIDPVGRVDEDDDDDEDD